MITKKPFLSITPDVDDDAIAALARTKGVPELTPQAMPAPRRAITIPDTHANDRSAEATEQRAGHGVGQGAPVAPLPSATAQTSAEPAPTPRARISYVKAGIPDYALVELKTRALTEKVSLNHLLLAALRKDGITIHDADMVEDGRRIRGSLVTGRR